MLVHQIIYILSKTINILVIFISPSMNRKDIGNFDKWTTIDIFVIVRTMNELVCDSHSFDCICVRVRVRVCICVSTSVMIVEWRSSGGAWCQCRFIAGCWLIVRWRSRIRCLFANCGVGWIAR